MADRGKNRRSSLSRFGRWLIYLTAIFGTSWLHHPAVGGENNRSLIFVVDTSERMSPYLSSVKGTILTYADQSKRGDYLGIISASNTAKLLTIKKISGPSDRKSLGIMLDALSAEGEVADVARGLARAVEETGTLKRRGDNNVKGIILISSSKSIAEEETAEILGKSLQGASNFVREDEWYIQYCYLGGALDPQIERFAKENNGFVYDVDALRSEHGLELIAELYSITEAPEELCPMRLIDLTGVVLAKEPATDDWVTLKPEAVVTEETHLKVGDNSRAVITLGAYGKIGLGPETDITLNSARQDPMTGDSVFRLALGKGSIWTQLSKKTKNTLRISSTGVVAEITGKVAAVIHSDDPGDVRVSSFSDALSVKVSGAASEPLVMRHNQSTHLGPGQTFMQPEPVEARLIEKWKSWSMALSKSISLRVIDFSVPEVVFPQAKITLGPIKSGEVHDNSFPVRLIGVSDDSRLKMGIEVSLALPEGLSLSTGIVDGDEPDEKMLLLKLDGSNGFRSRGENTYNGFLKITPAPRSEIVFKKVSVPLTITTKGLSASPAMLLAAAVATLIGVAIVGAILMLRRQQPVRPRPHRVIGRLIVINDPTGGRVGSINLEEIGTKSSRLSLVVGRNRGVEVRLKHKSVNPEHCTMEAQLVGRRLMTYIAPIESAKVAVNDERITSKTCLNDGARIGIGEFTYQFEDTHLYKKVDIVYRNGRTISGVLDATGMDAEGFRLSPMDAVSPSERARVKFSDIRYVTFYRRVADILSETPRPKPKPNSMKRVELMFRKGNTISGYVQREYVEGRSRFVELLPLDPESEIDYTVVEYSAVVEKRTL